MRERRGVLLDRQAFASLMILRFVVEEPCSVRFSVSCLSLYVVDICGSLRRSSASLHRDTGRTRGLRLFFSCRLRCQLRSPPSRTDRVAYVVYTYGLDVSIWDGWLKYLVRLLELFYLQGPTLRHPGWVSEKEGVVKRRWGHIG
ncbi:hypothetical protein LZ32DRAFT_85016 [Colletotrichum eremochloae]|nr:hypothetical protein LZ32DRAFT_85016 [Colletotrichum eremochloae]